MNVSHADQLAPFVPPVSLTPAGGVIGGLVAAALVAVGVWYVAKKRRTAGAGGMAISNPAFEQAKSGGEAATRPVARQLVYDEAVRRSQALQIRMFETAVAHAAGRRLHLNPHT